MMKHMGFAVAVGDLRIASSESERVRERKRVKRQWAICGLPRVRERE
jgi:hypothetical protein